MSGKHLPPEDRKSRPRPGRASTCADWRPLEVLEPRLLLSAAPVLGDLDGNGVLDAFDASAFELALTDAPEHKARFPGVDLLAAGDANGDGRVDSFDAARLFQSDRGQGASASADVAISSAPSLTAALAHDTGHSDTDLLTNDPAIAGQVVSEHPIEKLYLLWTHPLGDLNGDGSIDAFDIAPMELALAHPEQYAAEYPGLDAVLRGDMNRDGRLDAFDVVPYEVLLAGGGGGGEPPPPFPGFEVTHALAGDGSFHLSRALIEETVSAPLEDRTHVFGFRAVDDQCNSSELVEVSFTLDTAAPALTAVDPPPGASRPQGLEAITLTFSEFLDTAAITPAHFTLTEAGEDGQFNTGDEVNIPITDLAYSKANARVTLLTAPLALGTYRLETAAGLPDPAGNELEAGQALTEFVMRVDNPGYEVINMPPAYEVAPGPVNLAMGDLNGDGHADVVTVHYAASAVSVLLGDASGGFGPYSTFAVDDFPIDVALGDLDGDGLLDIVTVSVSNTTILFGDGLGGVRDRLDIRMGRGPRSVALGDLNNDGLLDIVASSTSTATFSVILGVEPGVFAPERFYNAGIGTETFTLGDVNEDGILDVVVVASENSAGGVVLVGDGAGAFSRFSNFTLAGTIGASAVILGDVNADGHLDVISVSGSQFTNAEDLVSVSLGDGDGHFAAPERFSVGRLPRSVALADFDGDGNVDIVTANNDAGTVSILLGNGEGVFNQRSDFGVANQPGAVALADVDGDGNVDILTANWWQPSVTVLRGDGAGAFDGREFHEVGTMPLAVAIGDFNNDGEPDIITANLWDASFTLLRGNGAGGVDQQADLPVGILVFSLVLADLNHDGHLDIVAAAFSNDAVWVFPGNGEGDFMQGYDYAVGSGPQSLSLADLNGDGYLDAVTADTFGDTVSVLLGDGMSGFNEAVAYAVGVRPESVALGDINGDGYFDIVTANAEGQSVSVLFGNGVGGFTQRTDHPLGKRPTVVALADLSGDGDLDIVTANGTGNTVSVLLGDGAGAFNHHGDFGVGNSPRALKLGDIDGDGDLDIVTANWASNDVTVLSGNGAGGFGSIERFYVGPQPQSLALGDLDGDGDLDIIASSGDITFSPPNLVTILLVERTQ